jgi:AraC family transcriptional regulator of adaptative response/methylated-DNA-[protein]-cysteine methyltransferase
VVTDNLSTINDFSHNSKIRVAVPSATGYDRGKKGVNGMKVTASENDYQRVEKAILFLEKNALLRPDLKEIARAVNLSEYHFQRLFRRWAGISPKRFLQALTLERA